MPGINPPIPYQWSVADVGSAALLNAQLYNGLTFLTNPPRFSGSLTASQTLATNSSTFTSVLIDTEYEDTENGHSTTTNSQRYTCQIPGLYLVTGSVAFANNATGFRAAKLQINGNDVVGSENICLPISSGSLPTVVPVVPSYVRMVAGDFVLMQAIQNSGGNLALTAVGASQTVFAVQYIAA